ncbi:MAG: hypothetical protein GXO89_04355, partial [Chlorobi bacterium]|nr:hypothetical protein [Chlorobiota bacterium]
MADQSLGTSGFDFGQALIETSDGGFLVGGSSKVQSGGNVTCQPYSTDKADAVLFKLDMDLNIEWQKCYGGSYDESITGLLEHENGYLFVAYTTSDDGDVSGLHGPTDEATDNWVVSIDFDGNLLWQNCLGGTLYEFADVLLQMDNGFMVVGQTESQDGDVVGNHSQSEYSNDIWLVKLNGEGDLLWQQCIGGLGNEETRFGAIKKSDTDFVIAGQFNKGPSFDVGCVPFGLYADMPDVWIFEVK